MDRSCRAAGRGGHSNYGLLTDDDGWEQIRDNEVLMDWIKQFDKRTDYTGDRALTGAHPFDFLSLFLTEEFWNMVTNETNHCALIRF